MTSTRQIRHKRNASELHQGSGLCDGAAQGWRASTSIQDTCQCNATIRKLPFEFYPCPEKDRAEAPSPVQPPDGPMHLTAGRVKRSRLLASTCVRDVIRPLDSKKPPKKCASPAQICAARGHTQAGARVPCTRRAPRGNTSGVAHRPTRSQRIRAVVGEAPLQRTRAASARPGAPVLFARPEGPAPCRAEGAEKRERESRIGASRVPILCLRFPQHGEGQSTAGGRVCEASRTLPPLPEMVCSLGLRGVQLLVLASMPQSDTFRPLAGSAL